MFVKKDFEKLMDKDNFHQVDSWILLLLLRENINNLCDLKKVINLLYDLRKMSLISKIYKITL